MPSNNQPSRHQELVTVPLADRWPIYHRLQALDISCQCGTNQPLQVKVDDLQTAIQLWSVAKQFTASRGELVDWLNQCGQIPP